MLFYNTLTRRADLFWLEIFQSNGEMTCHDFPLVKIHQSANNSEIKRQIKGTIKPLTVKHYSVPRVIRFVLLPAEI